MSVVLSLMLKFRIEILPAARKALERAPHIMIEELTAGLQRALLVAENAIKQRIMSIHLFDEGDLHDSIHSEVIKVTATSFRGEVAPGVVYASIHERGGVIEPKNGRVLVWTDKGVQRPAPDDKESWKSLRKAGLVHVAKRVTIKAKHYMRDGLKAAKLEIRRVLHAAIKRGWHRILRGDR